MSQVRRIAAVAALALGASAVAAHAQLPGLPVFIVPAGTGFSVAADAGFADGANTYALTGGVGLGRIGLSVSLGGSDIDVLDNTEATYGAQAGIRLFGGGLNPLAIGAQAGYASVDVGGKTSDRIPVGATIRFSPPAFPLKPWGVAYYDLGDLDEARFTIGVDFTLLPLITIRGGYDWGDKGGDLYSIGAEFKFGAK
jgi:hypothetical protein